MICFYWEVFKWCCCLIVVDGWVEWKGEGKFKFKFYIDCCDVVLICFVGLWDWCEMEDVGIVESFMMVM